MIPEIGSPERNAREERALERGRELLAEHEGRIRTALDALHSELYDELRTEAKTLKRPGSSVTASPGLPLHEELRYSRDYTRELVEHVEGCWATSALR